MTRAAFLTMTILLAGCGSDSPDGNEAPPAIEARAVADQCSPPALAMADNSKLESKLLDETMANFTLAYGSACKKGVLKEGTLIDPKAADQGKLFLVNAPEANIASIYLSEVDGNRMVLEYPFLTTDGKTHVPAADELEEGIYCAVVGATPEEQESSGRCLPD